MSICLTNCIAVHYNGKLSQYPFAPVINGRGYVWHQHMRKAGGTALCRFLSMNLNTTTPIAPFHCFIRNQDGKFLRTLSGQKYYPSLKSLENQMSTLNIEVVSNEDSGFPSFAEANMNSPQWLFLTHLRHPVARIISHIRETHDKVIEGLTKHLPPFTKAAWLSSYSFDHEKSGASPRQLLNGCFYDNYYTRVLTDKCKFDGPMTETDYISAERILSKFDICLVTEWFTDLAPLLQHIIGATDVEFSPTNRHGTNPVGSSPRIDRKTASNMRGIEISLIDSMLTSEQQLFLIAENQWDMSLYLICRNMSKFLVDKYLYN